jgi:hypothetical protein
MFACDLCLNFAEDISKWAPLVLGRYPRIKELLKGSACPQEFHLAVEIIRFGEDVFTPICCKQDDRSFLGKFKDVCNIDRLFGEVNQLHNNLSRFPALTLVIRSRYTRLCHIL